MQITAAVRYTPRRLGPADGLPGYSD